MITPTNSIPGYLPEVKGKKEKPTLVGGMPLLTANTSIKSLYKDERIHGWVKFILFPFYISLTHP